MQRLPSSVFTLKLMWNLRLSALAVCFCLGAATAAAQVFEDVDAGGTGGGISAAGPYVLEDTIGQTCAAGLSYAGLYSVQGGFWSLLPLPPLAQSPRYEIVTGQDLHIDIWGILVAGTDAEFGANPTLVFEPVSAHGGVLSRSGNELIYTAPQGLTGTDSFTFTVWDLHGEPATCSVTVIVKSGPRPVVLYSVAVTNGSFVAAFSALPGTTYTIEYTDTLAPANWQKLTNVTAPASVESEVPLQLAEPLSAAPVRFYRVLYPAR